MTYTLAQLPPGESGRVAALDFPPRKTRRMEDLGFLPGQQVTALLLKETLAAGKTLVLPRCAEGHALDLCVVTSMDELVPGMYGILEPKADCALVTPADIDFAVVPCLSFDRRGRRLGQGGGYYDRLLPQLACPTCLICRERLMSEAVPTEEHDRRCTLYVTERGVMEPET